MKKRPTKSTRKGGEHAILVRLPIDLHRELRDKAEEEQRSVVGHVRHLIEQNVKEAA